MGFTSGMGGGGVQLLRRMGESKAEWEERKEGKVCEFLCGFLLTACEG